MIILIAWVACAFWCRRIADRQGRPDGPAFAAGLLFGIFAVLWYLRAGVPTAEPGFRACLRCNTRRYVSHAHWRCPSCHTLNESR